MRNTYKPLLALMASAMLFGACSEDNIVEELIVDEPSPVKGNVTFAASMADDDEGTRASIGAENTIVWDEGDEISVLNWIYPKKYYNKGTLSSGAGTTNGSFVGTCETGTDVYAIYPYSEDNDLRDNPTENIKAFYIDWKGANQTAVLGSFPLNTPMVAYTPNVAEGATTIPLSFQNVCAFVKFTTDYACKKVVLSAKGEEYLASEQIYVEYDNNQKPCIYKKDGATSSTVTLTGKDGANLVAGTYYIAVMPGKLASGFDLAFTNIYGEKTYTKSTTKSVTFKRGTILNLGEISIKSGMIHMAGSGTEANPYLINDFDQLEEMRDFVNYSTGGADYYKLVNNIDGGGKSFTPIGTQGKPFFGHFDGNGKTISNIKLDKTSMTKISDLSIGHGFMQLSHVSALFGVIKDATIKNVTLDQMTTYDFTATELNSNYTLIKSPFIGLVLGNEGNSSLISNITINANQNIVMNDLKKNDNTYWTIYGSVVGASFANMTVENCTNYNSISSNSSNCVNDIGGIVGTIMGGQEDDGNLDFDAKVNVIMCRNFGNIAIESTSASVINIGGIIAYGYDDNFDDDVKIQVLSCVNFGNINANLPIYTHVAGIVGAMESDGFGSEDPVIFCCINNGAITASDNAAGICGSTYDENTQVNYCANTGTITSQNPNSIVGNVRSEFKCGTISHCWNNNTSCAYMSDCRGKGNKSIITDSNNNGGTVDECITLMNEQLAEQIAEPSIYFVHTWKKYAGDATKLDLDF